MEGGVCGLVDHSVAGEEVTAPLTVIVFPEPQIGTRDLSQHHVSGVTGINCSGLEYPGQGG